MLGKTSKRLQKQLEESGTRANATVVEIDDKGMAITHGQQGVVANTEIERKARIRVKPDGEPEFEVTKRFRFSQFDIPSAGQVIAVIFDPSDHDKVMLDRSRFGGQRAMLEADGLDPSQISGEVEDLEMAELEMLERGETMKPQGPGESAA